MTSQADPANGFGPGDGPDDLKNKGKRLLAPNSQSIDIETCYHDFEVFETRLPGFSSLLGSDLGEMDKEGGKKEKDAGISWPRLPFSRSVDDNVVFNSMHSLADAYRV